MQMKHFFIVTIVFNFVKSIYQILFRNNIYTGMKIKRQPLYILFKKTFETKIILFNSEQYVQIKKTVTTFCFMYERNAHCV